MSVKRIIMICLSALIFCATSHAQEISFNVEKIWDNGMHNAFTSIEKFKGEYYITFREGETHIFDKNGNAEGKIRILHSKDGQKWEALPAIGKAGYDLRDPKFSVTPDGRLMVIIGGSIYRNRELVGSQPHVMFSTDGRTFTQPQPVNVDERYRTERDWLWRVTWHNGVGYSVSYGRTDKGQTPLYLYSTTDGINYKHIQSFEIDNFPNEATIRFLEDGRMA
ncbi:MAG: exo-alpha-sialidase, partial [Alistipes sp.]|nr:exo-alpha-sialidase [Alistipes sp.]